jgi:hypothetical protein
LALNSVFPLNTDSEIKIKFIKYFLHSKNCLSKIDKYEHNRWKRTKLSKILLNQTLQILKGQFSKYNHGIDHDFTKKQSCTISSRTFFTFRFLLPLTVSHVFQSLSDNSHVFQSLSDNSHVFQSSSDNMVF